MDVAFHFWNDRRMLEAAALQVFVKVVDAGSVSGAARALGMPKSSVSRTLVRLEAAAGAALLERTPRRQHLTDAGRLLLRHARRILDDVAEAETALGGLVGVPRGEVTVCATTTFAAGPLAQMLPGFLSAYPEIRVRLVLATAPVDLLAREVDVAIRMGPLADSAMIARRVATVPRWLCASPTYLAGRPPLAGLADLAAHRVLHSEEGPQRLVARDAGGGAVEARVVPALAAREPVVLVNLALGGAGVAILPWVYVRESVARGRLARLLPELDFGAVEIHALYPSHRSLSAKVRAFLDALIAHLADGRPEAFRPR